MNCLGELQQVCRDLAGPGPFACLVNQPLQYRLRRFVEQAAQVRTPVGRRFARKQRMNELIFRELFPVPDVGGRAGHAKEVGPAPARRQHDGQVEPEQLQHVLHFLDPEVGKHAVLQLVERRAGKAGFFCQGSLRHGTRGPGPAYGRTDFLQSHRAANMFNILDILVAGAAGCMAGSPEFGLEFGRSPGTGDEPFSCCYQ